MSPTLDTIAVTVTSHMTVYSSVVYALTRHGCEQWWRIRENETATWTWGNEHKYIWKRSSVAKIRPWYNFEDRCHRAVERIHRGSCKLGHSLTKQHRWVCSGLVKTRQDKTGTFLRSRSPPFIFCLVLSCLVLSCLVLSCLALVLSKQKGVTQSKSCKVIISCQKGVKKRKSCNEMS